MAFFKFRFPGQAASSSATPDSVGAGPGESVEALRRRARHRLMGAVVLVTLAVLGFPLLFDTQPRPVRNDTPVLLPDRYSSGSLLVPPISSAPVLPSTPSLPAQAGLDDNEEQVPEPAMSAPQMPVEVANADQPAVQEPAVPPKAADAKTLVQPAPIQPTQAQTKTKPKDEGGKALALLEGRSPPAVQANAAVRHVVQVGAFTDPAKVREARRKLEQAGLATFIQVVDGQNGKSTTRVRVGPFSSREEAEKAAAKIRQLNFAPAVLRL